MVGEFLLVIDQGTSSTRVVIYDRQAQPAGQAAVEVLPTYPHPGWVEHDVAALLASVWNCIPEALASAGIAGQDVAAIGLTNQRETTVLWDRATGKALAPAIVWQDRRTAPFCQANRDRSDWLAGQTGLVLDSYFSATKLAWLLDHVPDARSKARSQLLAAGTVDSLLLWHLTGGERHLTDLTNASRTLLMNIHTLAWDQTLLDFFAIAPEILPEILPSSGLFGATRGVPGLPDGIPITGVAGDQQASLVGQGCVTPGQAKCTYGTGAFLLVHCGTQVVRSTQGLVTTPAAALARDAQGFAIEGSVFIAGAAVQWFRDGLKAVGASPEIDPMSEQASADSEILFVPALTGLGAPHWEPAARGTIFGLTRSSTLPDLARATLEGVAQQVADLFEAIQADAPARPTELRADGGMARSDPFLQYQADLLGLPIRRSTQTESTALGAALLAGTGAGFWPDAATATRLVAQGKDTFTPRRDASWRHAARRRWRHAVESVTRHYRST